MLLRQVSLLRLLNLLLSEVWRSSFVYNAGRFGCKNLPAHLQAAISQWTAARIQPVAPISKPRFPCAHKAILETFVSNLNLCSKTHTHTHRGIPVQGGQIGYQMLLAVKQCLNTGSRKNHTRQRQQKERRNLRTSMMLVSATWGWDTQLLIYRLLHFILCSSGIGPSSSSGWLEQAVT